MSLWLAPRAGLYLCAAQRFRLFQGFLGVNGWDIRPWYEIGQPYRADNGAFICWIQSVDEMRTDAAGLIILDHLGTHHALAAKRIARLRDRAGAMRLPVFDVAVTGDILQRYTVGYR